VMETIARLALLILGLLFRGMSLFTLALVVGWWYESWECKEETA